MGNDYEWKIGDIDRVLQGNVKVTGWKVLKRIF